MNAQRTIELTTPIAAVHPKRRLDAYTVFLVGVGMLAGIGAQSIAVVYFGLDPILPGAQVSAAQAAELADEERLREFEQAAKRIKKPNLKAKS